MLKIVWYQFGKCGNTNVLVCCAKNKVVGSMCLDYLSKILNCFDKRKIED